MKDIARPSILFLSAFVAVLAIAAPDGSADPQVGVDYSVLEGSARQFVHGNSPEIVEIFWYGCPFCQDFEPTLKSWLARHQGTVAVSLMPAAVGPELLPGAKTYYALKELGLVSKFHEQFLDAARKGDVDTTDPTSIFRWFASHGVDESIFEKVYGSRRVQNEVERARRQELGYEVVSIPTLIVNGKYLTSTRMAGGFRAVLRVVDFLLSRSR